MTDVEEISDFGLPKTKRWFVLKDFKTNNLAGQVLLEATVRKSKQINHQLGYKLIDAVTANLELE